MLRTALILYLSCFAVYILFTRQPDYFEGEITTGTVVSAGTLSPTVMQNHAIRSNDHPVVQFAEGHETYYYNGADNFFQQGFEVGEKVKIVFNPGNPAEANIYSFLGYWIDAKELLFTLAGFIILFGVAIAITGKNQTVSDIEVGVDGKMKYN